MNIEAIFYDLPSGEEPAKEFIKSLPVGDVEKCLEILEQSEENK